MKAVWMDVLDFDSMPAGVYRLPCCPKCGKQLLDDLGKCAYCGEILVIDEDMRKNLHKGLRWLQGKCPVCGEYEMVFEQVSNYQKKIWENRYAHCKGCGAQIITEISKR